MQIKPFQALYPDRLKIATVSDFFDSAKEKYAHYLQSGLFTQIDKPAVFLYQIQSPGRIYTGVLACADIQNYLLGNIKKHEHTIRAEEEKQIRITLERQAAVKPVLLTYPENDLIDRWIMHYTAHHPVFLEIDFPAEEQIHRLWAVQENNKLEQLQQLFAEEVPHAYIADGHHRMSAMELICRQTGSPQIRQTYRDVLCAFLPSGQLDILEFNRLIALPESWSVAAFLEKAGNWVDLAPISVAAKPKQKHDMTLCTAQGWYHVRWKNVALQELASEPVILDTMLLNKILLGKILGITDVRNDRRVEYVDAPKGLEAIQNKVDTNPDQVGVCLYPVAFDDLMNLVEAGGTMPPKSTWFEPRMKNGLIVKPYNV